MKAQRTFAKICGNLSSATGKQRVFEYLVEGLQDLQFSLVLVLEKKEEGNKTYLQGRNSLGFEEEFDPDNVKLQVGHDKGIISKSLLTDDFIVTKANKKDPELEAIESSLELNKLNLMVAPLSRKGSDKIYGVTLAGKEPDQEISEEEKTYFHTIAQQAGLILEKTLLKKNIDKRRKELQHRIYELNILQELSQRIGYSLNIERIATVIINSLSKLLEFSAASYTLVKPEKVIFSCHLDKMVNRKFVDEMKQRSLNSLNTIMQSDYKEGDVDEVLSGTILDETQEGEIQSFFNIPFVIQGKPVGVLTVASTKKGLYQEDEMTILYKITDLASKAISKLQAVIETEKGKLQDMVESMGDGVVMVDTQLGLEIINNRAKSFLDLKKEELTVFEIVDSFPDQLNFKDQLEENLKKGTATTINEVAIEDTFLRVLITPVKSETLEGEKLLGAVILLHDITEEKELQKLREEFTSMMVHELRSPLDGIKKMSELLLDEETRKDEKSVEKFLSLIHNESADMLSLVGDLLDLSKLESGRIQLHKEPHSLERLIDERFEYYRTQAEEKNLKLSKDLSPELPQKLEFDKNRINQVLNNFLSNAIKFTPEKGEVRIQAFNHEKGNDFHLEAKANQIDWFLRKNHQELNKLEDSVVVAVTDTGPGIKKKNQKKLFEKFQQFKAGEESEKRGTGLGLAVAKEIITAHQGEIGVASIPGEGSSFYFTLPFNNHQNSEKDASEHKGANKQ